MTSRSCSPSLDVPTGGQPKLQPFLIVTRATNRNCSLSLTATTGDQPKLQSLPRCTDGWPATAAVSPSRLPRVTRRSCSLSLDDKARKAAAPTWAYSTTNYISKSRMFHHAHFVRANQRDAHAPAATRPARGLKGVAHVTITCYQGCYLENQVTRPGRRVADGRAGRRPGSERPRLRPRIAWVVRPAPLGKRGLFPGTRWRARCGQMYPYRYGIVAPGRCQGKRMHRRMLRAHTKGDQT